MLGGRRRDQNCTITMSDAAASWRFPSCRAPLGRAGLFFFVRRILSIAFRTLKHPQPSRFSRKGRRGITKDTARKFLPREMLIQINAISWLLKF